MANLKSPRVDLTAVRQGDPDAFAVALAACASRWFNIADSHIAFRCGAADVVREGDTGKAGLFAAAMDLRALLTQSPQGRKALGDFGFQPVLEYIEGE